MTHKPHCGPFALAAILGKPVDVVESAYRQLHNKPARWIGRSNIAGLLAVADCYNLTLKPEGAGGSLKTWVADWTIDGRKYLVRVGNHFVAIIDGKVIDQIGADRIEALARCRVTHAFWCVDATKGN